MKRVAEERDEVKKNFSTLYNECKAVTMNAANSAIKSTTQIKVNEDLSEKIHKMSVELS
jgi:hypothetical protein